MDRVANASGRPRGAQLAARIAGGDAAAEDEFVRTFAPAVRHVLQQRLQPRSRDAVEDLCQETLCAALLHLRHGDLRAPERLAAYVWGIARNLARAHARGSRECAAATPPDPPDLHADPERPLIAREDREHLAACLAGLAPRDRELVAGLLGDEDKRAACARLGLSAACYDLAKFRSLRRLRVAWNGVQRKGTP